MFDNISEGSILKVVEIKNPGLEMLEHFRSKLNQMPHQADEVGMVGQEWLREVLDSETLDEVCNFVESDHKALLLRGLPLHTDVCTPTNGYLADELCVLDFDLLHFGMLYLLGIHPHAVDYENNGKIVRNVVPVSEAIGTTSSWGSDVEFFWHTDNPNWPFLGDSDDITACVPSFLAFTTVRNQEGASTDIACVDHILGNLPSWVVSELQKPSYTFSAPSSNEGHSGEKRIFPLLERSEKGCCLRFDEGIVEANDQASGRALRELSQFLKSINGISVVLQPGDFFVFKNTQVLHRRKAFQPFVNGEARWLRRVYGSSLKFDNRL
ncbi:TauD/TfdA family dioxygenase [Halomonas salifodinae]|uniref:TauD/TfdA family dioxygenase n=1 Tax=Halomonas salifodinae TaxID=438745 RepID=A0ABW2ESS1_9GAMM